MEKKQKNSIVTFMMVVGVAFILVAGCIFVRQAWKYLPEVAKQFCLLAVAAGSFTGSVFAGRTKLLKKTETALFYIGDVFLGYFILAVTGGTAVTELLDLKMATRLLAATLTMMIPMVVKLIWKQKIYDYAVTVVMANLAVIFAHISVEAKFSVYTMMMAVLTVILLVISQIITKRTDCSNGLKVCTKVCFMVQEIYTVLGIVLISFLLELGVLDMSTSSIYINIAFVFIGICVVLSSLIWYDKEDKAEVNIVQLTVLCGVFVNMLILNLLCGELEDALVLGITALVIAIFAGIKNNRLYVIISSITLLLIAFYITRTFWLSIAWWVYMFVAGVILVLIAVKKEKEGE